MTTSQASPGTTATASLRPLPPGPRGSWLLGSLGDFRQNLLRFYDRCAQTYGDIVPYRIVHRRLCLCNHPEFTEKVLITDARNYDKRTYVLKLLVPLMGHGLLTTEGDYWLRQRRLIQPAFHKQRIAAFAEVMVEYTLRTAARWQDGQHLDLHAEMVHLALEIVGKKLFDADVTHDAKDVGALLEVVMDDFVARWESVVPLPLVFPTRVNRRFKRTIRQLDAILFKMIAQRRQADTQRSDLLSLLLQARDEADGTGMTDQQLRDEAMTLFLAGHETTASALSFTLYLLALHPEVEKRLLGELTAVLGGRTATMADLPRLVFTEHVLMEAMRLYPPAYAFGRLAKVDCELGGYLIPRGTTIILSPWLSHRDARWFPDPLAFRPERWEGDLLHKLPRYAYFPFGGGPRLCIGNQFAMTEAMLVLATLVPRCHFELLPDPPVTLRAVVTLRPAQGVPVKLHRR
jgi:cytochrome P450